VAGWPPAVKVSASSDFNQEQFISAIDPNDRVDLQSLSGHRERLMCLGLATKQVIAVTTSGALTVFVYKAYVLRTDTSIVTALTLYCKCSCSAHAYPDPRFAGDRGSIPTAVPNLPGIGDHPHPRFPSGVPACPGYADHS
jgi:hypothetical protein